MTDAVDSTRADSARVEHIVVGGDAAAWQRIGLSVEADGTVPFLFASLRIDPRSEPGIRGWSLSGIDSALSSIDGLPTSVVAAAPPRLAEHPNGGIELDHVVVLTSSLDRTSGAIEAATGAPLRRVREVGPMRQGFHRLGRGGLIVEVVERPEVDADHAAFWGLVVNVVDLDVAVELIGPELIGPPNDAVQPGRRIATVQEAAGLGFPVALMSTG